MTFKEKQALVIGDEIYWNDPDDSEFSCSGIYTIVHINTDSGKIESHDSILLVKRDCSRVEIFAHEIS